MHHNKWNRASIMPNRPEILAATNNRITFKCNVCGRKDFKQSFPGLIQCNNCDFITANIALSAEDIHTLYGTTYFSGEEYVDYVGDKKIIQKNLCKWLKAIRRYRDSGVLIEIGSAYGFFLEIAEEHFQATGYEISEAATDYSNYAINARTYNTDFLDDANILPNSVDIVVMWDVIEHLPDPAMVIDKVQNVLKPNGHIFITTGDIDSRLAKFQGPSWRMIHPPSHLQYFSKTTLTKLLTSKGFEIVDIKYPGYWRTLGQILHGLFILGNDTNESIIYKLLLRIVPRRLGVYLNTYDIMLVNAKLAEKNKKT